MPKSNGLTVSELYVINPLAISFSVLQTIATVMNKIIEKAYNKPILRGRYIVTLRG